MQLGKNEAGGNEVLTMNKQLDQLQAFELEKLLICHNSQFPKKRDGKQKWKADKMESNTKFKSTAAAFSKMGSCQWEFKALQESKIDLNETALEQQKGI